MNLSQIHRVYFLGIGGIGMSALARYFQKTGKQIAGYDRTPTELTRELEKSGMAIHYNDDCDLIPMDYRIKEGTLVIYTPAIPKDHSELNYFNSQGFILHKRSEVLGLLTQAGTAVCVAGTHGKTTVSSMIAQLFYHSDLGCSAFLGGISKNFKICVSIIANSVSPQFLRKWLADFIPSPFTSLTRISLLAKGVITSLLTMSKISLNIFLAFIRYLALLFLNLPSFTNSIIVSNGYFFL